MVPLEDGRWTSPEPATFSANLQYGEGEPFFSPNGNRLYFISIRMSGRENAEGVLAALRSTFGDSIETGNRPNEHVWTGGNVFVLYDLDSMTGRGMAAMTSSAIHAQMRLDRSSAAASIGY